MLFLVICYVLLCEIKGKHLCRKIGFILAYMHKEVLLAPPFLSTLL